MTYDPPSAEPAEPAKSAGSSQTAQPAKAPEPGAHDLPGARGLADLGPADLGPADLGPADLGPADLGPADLGPADLGPADLGPADLGPADWPDPPPGPAWLARPGRRLGVDTGMRALRLATAGSFEHP